MSTPQLSPAQRKSETDPRPVSAELILTVPAGADLRRLSFANRVRLRLGIWLLQRSLPDARSAPAHAHATRPAAGLPAAAARSEHEALTQLAFELQRQRL